MLLVLVKLPLKTKLNKQTKIHTKIIKIPGRITVGSSSSQNQAPSSYTVQEGDSLSKIARENNTSVHYLEQLNGLESADSISIGQSIKLK